MGAASRRIRGRIATALAGSGIAVAILWPAPARADLPSISFAGSSLLNLPLLVCASQPDQGELPVTAGDGIRFDNHTGQPATLYVDGRPTGGTVAAGGFTVKSFPAGEYRVAMIPHCLLNLDSAGTTTVFSSAAHPSPTPTPTPKPSPSGRSTAAPSPVTQAPTVRTETADLPRPRTSHSRTAPAPPSHRPDRGAPSRTRPPSATPSPEPSVAAAPLIFVTPPKEPDYLLTLIAITGIVGVALAALRALHQQYLRR